jgi:hypothetical protein
LNKGCFELQIRKRKGEMEREFMFSRYTMPDTYNEAFHLIFTGDPFYI